MNKTLNAADIKAQVSLIELLNGLGFTPAKRTNKELLYVSMLRDSDTDPSFSVKRSTSEWYDHGLGKGGNIIDFGLEYWKGLPFTTILENVVQFHGQPLETGVETPIAKAVKAPKISNYKIIEVRELGNNPAITSFIQSRGIWDVAPGKLKEIYYFVEDEDKKGRSYFAAGWKNESGAWEIRNKYFKGTLGSKAITFIAGDENRLVMFEGYFNYLSWLYDHPKDNASILVLNSLSLLKAGIEKAREFGVVDIYFDRDRSGHKATLELVREVAHATDQSSVYKGHNDYNEHLLAKLRDHAPEFSSKNMLSRGRQ
ncbi:MAG: hypothetical protein EOO04_24160 [Chitinophagaceae bacterium]|nr:MAG: hypothetical protein EOO04_24160 [Chitinophagaceae bacterium]